jgi:hypothetical protein
LTTSLFRSLSRVAPGVAFLLLFVTAAVGGFVGEIQSTPLGLLDLDEPLGASDHFRHLGHTMLHKDFKELVGWRQSANECSGSYFVAAIMDGGYLILEARKIILQRFSSSHLEGQESVTVLQNLLSGDVLVDEGSGNLVEGVE